MDELRWILLFLGIAIIAAVYFFGDPKRSGRKDSRSGDAGSRARGDGELDEGLEEELERLGEVISKERSGEVGLDGATGTAAAVPPPDRVVVLYVKAPRGTNLSGSNIARAAEKAGLEYGDLNIFHRLNETGGRREPIYSLANITKPGDFDMARIDTLGTPGLCLFLTLPNPLPALDAWDAMLATGRRLADLLNADLQDESHSSLIRQRIGQIRDEMRDYDRSREGGV